MVSLNSILTSGVILVIIIISLVTGCAIPPDPKCFFENKLCGGRKSSMFTGTWHEYYLRGISYLDCKCYKAAVNDLTVAIKKKPADKRALNIYGMHFINYFPNRERAMAYYFLQEYDNALKDLQKSIKDEPSDKAFFYLNKVRSSLNLQNVAPRPTKIILNPPLDKDETVWIKDNYLLVAGRIYDINYISNIEINSNSLFIDKSMQNIRFVKKIYLNSGKNEIVISVKNLMNKTAILKRTIFVDNSGPVIAIHPDSSEKTINGLLIDDSPIKLFKVNGKIVNLNKNNVFSIPIKKQVKRINLEAEDNLGNITRAKYQDVISFSTKKPLLVRNFQSKIINDYEIATINSFNSTTIQLKKITDGLKVFKNHINFDGVITSSKSISSFTIKIVDNLGKLIFTKTKNIGSLCHILHFCEDISLKQGHNIASIIAKNKNGLIHKKKINIYYQLPSIFHIHNRYNIKLLPLDYRNWHNEFSPLKQPDIRHILNNDNQLKPPKKSLFLNLFIEKINKTKRFQITFDDNLDDELLTQYDKSIISRKPADALLISDTWEDRHGIEISTRLVDIETSKIIDYENVEQKTSFFDVYIDKKNNKSLSYLAKRLTEKLCNKLPIIQGYLSGRSKNSIIVSFDQSELDRIQNKEAFDKIILGWPVLIYFFLHNYQKNNYTIGSDSYIIDHGRIDALLANGYRIKTQSNLNINNNIEVITK